MNEVLMIPAEEIGQLDENIQAKQVDLQKASEELGRK